MLGNFIWMKSKPGSLGKPNPIYNVDIVDDEGNSCKTGEVGEIAIRTGDEKQPLGMFMGYYRDEELTREAWQMCIRDSSGPGQRYGRYGHRRD